MAKYLDENGLLYYNQKLNTKFDTKVSKEFKTGSSSEYKVLSDNNLTDALLTKINNAGDSSFTGDYDDLSNKPKINNVELTSGNNTLASLGIQPAGDYALSSEIPTNNNELTNGAGYQTASDVQNSINSAIGEITGIDFQIVESLPQTGESGTIYLISNSGTNPNIYDEYIYVNNSFEKIGTTDVDLTGYLKTTDMVKISNTEIDTIMSGV